MFEENLGLNLYFALDEKIAQSNLVDLKDFFSFILFLRYKLDCFISLQDDRNAHRLNQT